MELPALCGCPARCELLAQKRGDAIVVAQRHAGRALRRGRHPFGERHAPHPLEQLSDRAAPVTAEHEREVERRQQRGLEHEGPQLGVHLPEHFHPEELLDVELARAQRLLDRTTGRLAHPGVGRKEHRRRSPPSRSIEDRAGEGVVVHPDFSEQAGHLGPVELQIGGAELDHLSPDPPLGESERRLDAAGDDQPARRTQFVEH